MRDDGFFSRSERNRSAGDEIIEGVLLAAQREHEERKLKFYARLLATVALDPSYSAEEANALIRTAQRLSYRQLLFVALAVGARSGVFSGPIRGKGELAPGVLLDL